MTTETTVTPDAPGPASAAPPIRERVRETIAEALVEAIVLAIFDPAATSPMLEIARNRIAAAIASADVAIVRRETLAETIHWFLPSAEQADAIIAALITASPESAGEVDADG